MASKTCMNILCGTTSSAEWKGGWVLRSGEVASLCSNCGSVYQQQAFCETFHGDETGWRQCAVCGKQLHCGCVASLNLIEMLDNGGVKCVNCLRNGTSNEQMPSEFRTAAGRDVQISHLSTHEESNGTKQPAVPLNFGTNGLLGHKIKEDGFHPRGEPAEGVMISSLLAQSSMGLPCKKTVGLISADKEAKGYGAFISLGGPTCSLPSFCGTSVEGRERGGTALQQASPSFSILPKTMKSSLSSGVHSDLSLVPHMRIARPPVEGRGRNQLLPRYWPRITEQELQQISGDPNCTIVPLFEKVLSASDAGRIGRLVLPKACAEAYFPPISQPEGLPLKIQDVKGKEWIFQFRFWPNNNSRMYVLEGVTPCIQSMQLQAGDTVIFSRMDPEGKLVMGFRKASTSGTLQSSKESADGQINALPKQMKSAGGHIMWNNGERQGGALGDCTLQSSLLPPERKKSRSIGLKSKRLQNESEEALELKLTWEDVQDMLRAPNVSKPNVVIVEDYEFEEYEEPPVFGKSSIFGVRSSGLVEQWTQCDACLKWRKLPADVLLPSTWTCAENSWDKSRSSCSAPDELTPRELDMFLQLNKGFKKTKVGTSNRTSEEQESAELEALANAASLGDNASDPGTSSVAATTKHPRHRPGCSCIVCIQPPSGKGKHKPMCNCNVCSTVKRRFKTLMMRKKKRQSEQEAEQARRNHQTHLHLQTDEADVDSETTANQGTHLDAKLTPEHESRAGNQSLNAAAAKLVDSGKELDLNFGPEAGADLQVGLPHVSMKSLLQLASLPLETYMKQNGLSSLASDQQAERPVDEDRSINRSVDAEDESDDQQCLLKQGQTQTQ